jgi:hypothetical protein
MRNSISRLLFFVPALLIISSLHSVPANASADCERQFVNISSTVESRFQFSHARVDGRAVYFEHLPAKRGKPTLFLLNGMFVPSMDLQEFRNTFEQKSEGEGLLIMYYSTQLESLYLRGLLGDSPALNVNLPEGRTLTRQDLALEAAAVLKASGAKGSIYPTGYSFGSGPVSELAALMGNRSSHGARIKEVIFLSPFVHAGEQVAFGGAGAEALIRMNPFFGEAAIQKMRAQSVRSTAAASIDDYIRKIGSLPEGVSREIAIHGVSSQINSLMDFDLRTVSDLALPTRFILAQKEGTLRLTAQKEAFEAMKKSGAEKVELTMVPDATHHLLAYEPVLGVDALFSVLRPSAR